MSNYRSAEQERYAATIASYLAEPDEPLLLHGAAGLGKTRALLIESFKWAAAYQRRVLIATATTQLASQMLVSTDMAYAREAAGTHLTVERYISQRQIVSPTRAAKYGLSAQIGEGTDDVLARYDAALRPEDISIDARCTVEEKRPYAEQRERCRTASIVVTTHAALILDWRTGGRLLDLRLFDLIIIDEADRLPAAASLQLDAVITRSDFDYLGVELDKDNLPKTLRNVLSAIDRERKRTTDESLLDFIARLRANASDMAEAIAQQLPWRVVGVSGDDLVLRVVEPARILSQFFTTAPATICTSGTLAVNDRLTPFKWAVGIRSESKLSAIIEPARHGKLSYFLAARELAIDSLSWFDSVVRAIGEARKDGGKVLVLTTSYALAEKLGAQSEGATTHRRGETLASVLRRFDGNLLITPSGWEGLDMSQPWTDVVIPRIPYPGPDAVLDIPFVSKQDQAIRRLTQGMARGVRRPDQECTVWILDSRFPVSAALVNTGTITQGAAARHTRLAYAIPRRFREGLRATYPKASIWK